MQYTSDPLTRYLHVTYPVPLWAPDAVTVCCSWSPPGRQTWQPANVHPLLSETGRRLASVADWQVWTSQGRLTERRAAGLRRTVVFNPYPDAQTDGRVEVDFRVQLLSPEGDHIATGQIHLQADNRDVVYLEDWSRVLQSGALSPGVMPAARCWRFATDLTPAVGATLGNALYGTSPPDCPLPQLTYPLDLHGPHAVFARTVIGGGAIRLRLSGDERTDLIRSAHPGEEVFWRWAAMDRQHLVLQQPHDYTGYQDAHLDYVKLVPMPPALVEEFEAWYSAPTDRLVVGYWEPYSWAFHSDIRDNPQHREPLAAYVEARVPVVDAQLGRGGMKVVYESRQVDQLLHATVGDPIGAVTRPTTDNVGRLQQYTNTLQTESRYARELGLQLFANFGASNCYPGTPLENDFSRAHPEWRRGHALRYEVPEVRQHMLGLYREALEIGAMGVSVDFGRYPQTVDRPETATEFLRQLRDLARACSRQRGAAVPVLVHFPAQGDTLCENFDYATWVREELVDYLCPAQHSRVYLFDLAPYVAAVRGSRCQLLPDVYGDSPALLLPGLFLSRVHALYEAGAHGVYVYQSDSPVVYGPPLERRCLRLIGSRLAVARWWAEEQQRQPGRSKGIYLTQTLHNRDRVRIWLEGVPEGEMELRLDGALVAQLAGPPYLLGDESALTDGLVAAGEHELAVRIRDGSGWLEQTFLITSP